MSRNGTNFVVLKKCIVRAWSKWKEERKEIKEIAKVAAQSGDSASYWLGLILRMYLFFVIVALICAITALFLSIILILGS